MSISRFNLDTASLTLERLYNFLISNKAGTFLDNMTITLSEDNKALTIASTNATFSIETDYHASGNPFVTFAGSITSTLYGGSSNTTPRLKGAALCPKGLIIEVDFINRDMPEIVLTVDSTNELAVIVRSAAYIQSGSTLTNVSGYRVTTANSSSEAVVTLTPQHGAQKTSLAPIVPMCNDNSISLPYAYAALHTQASGFGLQAMTMDGVNYLTNGYWYIKDGV